MACPRPILKRPATTPSPPSLRPSNHDRDRNNYAVHFPPSPTLTRTFSVYSASCYDRSPIVVGPNTCALPERGCPGRTYTLEESNRKCISTSPKRSISKGRHLHPRSIGNTTGLGLLFAGDEACEVPIGDQHPSNLLPPLVFDLSSSESDESDGLFSPLSHHSNIPFAPSPLIQDPLDDSYPCTTPVYVKDAPKQRKRVRSPSRRPRRREPDDTDDESTASRSSWTKYKNFSDKSLKPCNLALPDEGCFGGF
jgi:hypothetical protein